MTGLGDLFTLSVGSVPAPYLVLAKAPSLARAQHAVVVRLAAAMDMSLCGDAVRRLASEWPAAVTGHGLAVVAHESGTRLEQLPGPLLHDIALPAGIAVEDYRRDRR